VGFIVDKTTYKITSGIISNNTKARQYSNEYHVECKALDNNKLGLIGASLFAVCSIAQFLTTLIPMVVRGVTSLQEVTIQGNYYVPGEHDGKIVEVRCNGKTVKIRVSHKIQYVKLNICRR
jgi:hypothetical protein